MQKLTRIHIDTYILTHPQFKYVYILWHFDILWNYILSQYIHTISSAVKPSIWNMQITHFGVFHGHGYLCYWWRDRWLHHGNTHANIDTIVYDIYTFMFDKVAFHERCFHRNSNSVIPLYDIISLQNFAHATTAQLVLSTLWFFTTTHWEHPFWEPPC